MLSEKLSPREEPTGGPAGGARGNDASPETVLPGAASVREAASDGSAAETGPKVPSMRTTLFGYPLIVDETQPLDQIAMHPDVYRQVLNAAQKLSVRYETAVQSATQI